MTSPSTIAQMMGFHFLWPNNIPLCVYVYITLWSLNLVYSLVIFCVPITCFVCVRHLHSHSTPSHSYWICSFSSKSPFFFLSFCVCCFSVTHWVWLGLLMWAGSFMDACTTCQLLYHRRIWLHYNFPPLPANKPATQTEASRTSLHPWWNVDYPSIPHF